MAAVSIATATAAAAVAVAAMAVRAVAALIATAIAAAAMVMAALTDPVADVASQHIALRIRVQDARCHEETQGGGLQIHVGGIPLQSRGPNGW